MTSTKGTHMITVKLTQRVWEECTHCYTADDDAFSPDCWGFMHIAVDANPTRNRAVMIEVTQQQVNAVCDEILRSTIDIHDGENDLRAQRTRHANALCDFIQTYYKKGN